MARIAVLLSVVVVLLTTLVVGVFWLAGEKHLENCRQANKTGCTILPWSGRDNPSGWGR